MKLITKEIERALEKAASAKRSGGRKGTLRGTDGLNPIPVVVKFFNPTGSWSWFATEGERVGPGENDWRLFGLVEGFETELGSFSLAELASVKGPLGLGIERDLHFSGAVDVSSFPAKIVSAEEVA
jgi:hypothetical protein